MLRKILIGFILLITLAVAVIGGRIVYDFVLPFYGEDFDREKWRLADVTTCERAPMIADLRVRHLKPGLFRREVEALIGEPYCDKNGVVDYSLGACPGRITRSVPLLRLHYGPDGHLVRTRMSFPPAPALSPRRDLPAWEEFSGMSREEQAALALHERKGLVLGAQGERYGLNILHELLVVTPAGEVMFLGKYREGHAGLHGLAVKACESG
jgi:hypothetical protein